MLSLSNSLVLTSHEDNVIILYCILTLRKLIRVFLGKSIPNKLLGRETKLARCGVFRLYVISSVIIFIHLF